MVRVPVPAPASQQAIWDEFELSWDVRNRNLFRRISTFDTQYTPYKCIAHKISCFVDTLRLLKIHKLSSATERLKMYVYIKYTDTQSNEPNRTDDTPARFFVVTWLSGHENKGKVGDERTDRWNLRNSNLYFVNIHKSLPLASLFSSRTPNKTK